MYISMVHLLWKWTTLDGDLTSQPQKVCQQKSEACTLFRNNWKGTLNYQFMCFFRSRKTGSTGHTLILLNPQPSKHVVIELELPHLPYQVCGSYDHYQPFLVEKTFIPKMLEAPPRCTFWNTGSATASTSVTDKLFTCLPIWLSTQITIYL